MAARLFDFAVHALERRVSRRGFLVRAATAGSALAVAPIRYLTRPVEASALIYCPDCPPSSKCCDGYTIFCCTIDADHRNKCPPYTFIGGWWKCTNYTGPYKCSDVNHRFYLDCNRLPGRACPNGCRCALNNCVNRRECCNVFRYGQCNLQIPQVTEIACRVVKCINPCRAYPNNCNCTLKVDNNTCNHETHCLGGPPPEGSGSA